MKKEYTSVSSTTLRRPITAFDEPKNLNIVVEDVGGERLAHRTVTLPKGKTLTHMDIYRTERFGDLEDCIVIVLGCKP